MQMAIYLVCFIQFGPLSFKKFNLILYVFKMIQNGPSISLKLSLLIYNRHYD